MNTFITMKNICKYILLLSLAIHISCETQEYTNDTFEEDVINLWQLDQMGIVSDEDFVLTDCRAQSTIEFRENGTFQRVSFEKNDNNECVEIFNEEGTWDYSTPADLTLTNNGETDQMTASIGDIIEEENRFVETENGNFLRLHQIIDLDVGHKRIIKIYKKNQ